MSEYKLKLGKTGSAVVDTYKKVEQKFIDRFLEEDETSESGYTLKCGKTAEIVVGVYKKIENSVVGTYKKVEDGFVNAFLEKVDSDSETQQ